MWAAWTQSLAVSVLQLRVKAPAPRSKTTKGVLKVLTKLVSVFGTSKFIQGPDFSSHISSPAIGALEGLAGYSTVHKVRTSWRSSQLSDALQGLLAGLKDKETDDALKLALYY